MLHPTRLYLCSATPQAAEAPGMGKKRLEGWNSVHHDGVYAWGAGSTPAELRVRWLRSPPHTTGSLLYV
jgi:hypothetical protein